MPSDESTPLGQQLHNIMSLRLVLLRRNRDSEEEQLVDSILFLFDSYVKAGRSRSDITLMLARDFAFHSPQHHHQAQQRQQDQQSFQRQMSVPTMQHLSLGSSQHLPLVSSLPQQSQQTNHQVPPLVQFDHSHHGQNASQASFSNFVSCSDLDFQAISRKITLESALTTNGHPYSTPINGGHMSLTARNYSSSDFQNQSSPNSDHMGSADDRMLYEDPPMSLPNY